MNDNKCNEFDANFKALVSAQTNLFNRAAKAFETLQHNGPAFDPTSASGQNPSEMKLKSGLTPPDSPQTSPRKELKKKKSKSTNKKKKKTEQNPDGPKENNEDKVTKTNLTPTNNSAPEVGDRRRKKSVSGPPPQPERPPLPSREYQPPPQQPTPQQPTPQQPGKSTPDRPPRPQPAPPTPTSPSQPVTTSQPSSEQAPPPRPTLRPPVPVAQPKLPSRGDHNAYSITQTERDKYSAIFRREDPEQSGSINGEKAFVLFSRSQLPNEQLAQIWDLADQDKDGSLSQEEFVVAMFLINAKLSGKLKELPSNCPPELTISDPKYQHVE